MDIITIESSDDGDSCNDEDEVECSCVGANAKSPHANDDNDIGDDGNDNDDDNDSGSTSSSDDSIWNKTGLSLSLKRKSVDLLANHPADNGDGDVEVEKLGNPPPTAALQCSSNEQSNDNASKKTTETENAASGNKYITQDSVDNDDHDEEPLPPEVPINKDGAWRIVLLMDHREFGCRKGNFLPTVETNINNHFGGKYSEITTLPSADFLFVARLLSKATGQIMDERVLDLVIERKNVEDLSQCLIQDSKKYKPLSFFEAQMYKLRHCGVRKKLFLMEDDEDKAKCFFVGVKTPIERDKSLKRVKTIRKQIESGEFPGIEVFCTRNKLDTIKFLIRQLESFQKSFNPRRPPTKTMEQLKLHINEQMKNPTFLEYLRLRKQPGIGDVKAMKVIMDPSLEWDKSFVSPSSKKKTKATLEDRATFWNASSLAYIHHGNIHIKISLSERERILQSQAPPNWMNNNVASTLTKSNPSANRSETVAEEPKRPKLSSNDDVEPAVETNSPDQCGICSESIDIWADVGIVSCNRVAACGATFHQVCLTNQKYDINAHDGCFKCKAPSLFVTNHKSKVDAHCNPSKKGELDSSKGRIELLDEGDDYDDDDDVIILD